jgi:hypothetical protein
MNLEQARKICEQIMREHGLYCDYHEERREGEVRFVNLTLRFKIDAPSAARKKQTGGNPEK